MAASFTVVLLLILTYQTNQTAGLFKDRIAPIRPQIIEEHHNKNRMLLSFDPNCCSSIRAAKHYIASLKEMYPCLCDSDTKPNQRNKIYKQKNGDYHTYLSIQYDNDNIDNLNISCIDNFEINWNYFCLQFIDYELQFEEASTHTTDDMTTCNVANIVVANRNYVWHLDYMDGIIDNSYNYVETTSTYKNVDIFILDTVIQSTHTEFDSINYIRFDAHFKEKPLSLHGTHVAGIVAGKNVGMTQGSRSIPIYDYPICRISRGCSFSYIEDAMDKIISYLQDDEYDNDAIYNKRVVINLSVQTTRLPPQKWIDYLDGLFKQVVDLGGVIVASAGNKGIDACLSYPGGSKYVISVAGYGDRMEIYGNTGHCVDLYAPGHNIYSADIGSDNMSYKRLQGTSMSAAVITGLIANMLWVNNELTIAQIKNHLQTTYHSYNVLKTQALKCQVNGCHLVHWDCDSYNTELLNYTTNIENTPTIMPILYPTSVPTHSPTDVPTIKPTNQPNEPTNLPVQSPQIKDKECTLPENVRPCKCFIQYGICIQMEGCRWDINKMKCISTQSAVDQPVITPTNQPILTTSFVPTDIPTAQPTASPLVQLCCNAHNRRNNGVCKPKNSENECVLNTNCYWDENICLTEACLARKRRCSSNKQCCSGVCVRFRGVTHCT